jgi:quinol monooxygenase YgiN
MSAFRTAARLLAVTALVGMFALAAPRTPAGEKPHPIVAQVKASVKDSTRPFTLIVRLRAREDAGKKIEAAFARARWLTRKEKGCLAYDLNRDTKAPTHYLVYERWQNLESLEAHLKSRHTTALLKELGDQVAGPPEARILLPAGE